MATFFMFGKYACGSAEQISPERTEKARRAIEALGGKINEAFALLGEYDIVLIVDLPRMAEAMKASIDLKGITGISFFTSAALPIEEFDQLFGKRPA